MRKNNGPIYPLVNIDHRSLDQRNFNPSQNDIQRICRFFSIGKLQSYEKEKGISVSHSNFFVFAVTDQGEYAIKFYPSDYAKTIATEYALGRILTHHRFPTPLMHAGTGGKAFLAHNDLLAACYSYINGPVAWQCLNKKDTFTKINTAMLSLKNILSTAKNKIPLLKQTNLTGTINALACDSRSLASSDQKSMIDTCLLEASRSYQHHRGLFTRQRIHNNANLNNFLLYKKTAYTLDLSHVREDYILADLSSLLISCFFFGMSFHAVKPIVKNYLDQHEIKKDRLVVLNTLVKIGLIKEYLKNIRREKSSGLSIYPANITQTYLSGLAKRKKSITALLKNVIF